MISGQGCSNAVQTYRVIINTGLSSAEHYRMSNILSNEQSCHTVDSKKGKVEVKCTLVQALRLCTGHTAHRGSRGIAVFFLDHSTRRGWGISVTPRPLFTPGKDPVPIVQEAGWAPGTVWTGVENLAPTGIRSPDCPARSQSDTKKSHHNNKPCVKEVNVHSTSGFVDFCSTFNWTSCRAI